LTPERAQQLAEDYQSLLDHERSLAGDVPLNRRDAYTELMGFPARVVAESGLIFMADRKVQLGQEVLANQDKITCQRSNLEAEVQNYNLNLADGKWNQMMPGLVTGRTIAAWSSEVRWPWGEKTDPATNRPAIKATPSDGRVWREAMTADRRIDASRARWSDVAGLGPTGASVALLPANLAATWPEADASAPALEYDFTSQGGAAEAWLDFLPAFRLYPGLKLRVAISVDDGAATLVEVPGSSGEENETGTIRSFAVQNNYTRVRVPLPKLSAGRHTFRIRAVDSGAVISQLSLP
jgi:hypothetical protein